MAKKYIDAEPLRKEIEKRKHICDGVFERNSDTYYQGKAVAYQETLSFLDSLQQEQSCDTCTNDKGCVTCKDGELWEGKEQPSEDLKAEIKRYGKEEMPVVLESDLNDIARHFYELGKQSRVPVSEDLEEAAKEYVTTHLRNNEFPTADSAFIAGAKWKEEQDDKETADLLAIAHLQGMEQQKKEMMKEVTECELAEKDLALTWEDIRTIDELLTLVYAPDNEKGYYQRVLEEFNKKRE